MLNEDAGREAILFSQSDIKIFIANYLDKFMWICIFILATLTIAKVGYLSVYGTIILIFLFVISFLYGKVQKKFAYKIVANFYSSELRLYMYRTDNVISVGFDEIKSIRVNGYIIFNLKEGKVFYNDLQNYKLLSCLNKINKIQWGFLCKCFGPNRNVRTAISEN